MTPSQRVLLNTIAQYVRTFFNMVLSLYTVRLVLEALGQSDYGLYSLVAGVVAALGFITNSLVSTTQRFVSFYQGKKDAEKTREVFNHCLLIHVFMGMLIAVGLMAFAPLLFNGFLNIPEARVDAAETVYGIVVVMLFTTFMNSPFRALLTSHENIVYLSAVDMLDAVLKVVLVILMARSEADKLVFYAGIMCAIQFFNFLMLSVYSYRKYDECTWPSVKGLKWSFMKELFSFAGWNIYVMLCLEAKKQGFAIFINKVYGIVMNAAWGIGLQLSGYTQQLSSAIVNAMTPQIVKAEGGGDRERSIFLSNILSKVNFFLISLIGIPFIFEVDTILHLWLGTPPEYASFFAIMAIMALCFDSMTIGLTHINSAIGKIGRYSLVMATLKVSTLLLAWLLMQVWEVLYAIAFAYVFMEFFCTFVRIYMISLQAGFSVRNFYRDVMLRQSVTALMCVLVCYTCVNLFESEWRLLFTFVLSTIAYVISFYCIGLSRKEKQIVGNIFNEIKRRIKKA